MLHGALVVGNVLTINSLLREVMSEKSLVSNVVKIQYKSSGYKGAKTKLSSYRFPKWKCTGEWC